MPFPQGRIFIVAFRQMVAGACKKCGEAVFLQLS